MQVWRSPLVCTVLFAHPAQRYPRPLLSAEPSLKHSMEAMELSDAEKSMAAETMVELGDEVRRLRAKLVKVIEAGGEAAAAAAKKFDEENPASK